MVAVKEEEIDMMVVKVIEEDRDMLAIQERGIVDIKEDVVKIKDQEVGVGIVKNGMIDGKIVVVEVAKVEIWINIVADKLINIMNYEV